MLMTDLCFCGAPGGEESGGRAMRSAASGKATADLGLGMLGRLQVLMLGGFRMYSCLLR